MVDKYIQDIDPWRYTSPPKLSNWSCYMFGMGRNGICYTPKKHEEPNWFWRKMQYICFGNEWVYTKETK